MKNGRFNSLTALATELERRAEAKKDYVADTRHVVAEVIGDAVTLAVGNEQFGINDLAHRQIGEATNVPAGYYDKMRKDAPDLLAANVNRWLRQEPAKKTIRILDGNVRAFLSDKYKPIENEDMAARILPVLLERDLDIMSADLTERRMYIKVVNKSVSRDLAKIGGAFGDGKHNILRTVSPAL